MLTEIYAFNKPGAEKSSGIVIPSAIEGMSKSMILKEDELQATELMRAALKEVLAEQE